jgi:tripartite-type tricarboxylate transporter receptor subunit TctC
VEYLPEVPTAQEQGLDVNVSQYRFMTVPKGTPESVTEPLVEAMQEVFASEEYKEFNEANALTPLEIPGEEVVQLLEEDKQRYAELVEKYDIDLSQS